MAEPADFGDTLNSLASFGASIGTTIGTTYRAVNQSSVPRTNIPQSSFNVVGSSGTSAISVGNILVYVLIGLAVVFGIKMLRK